MNRQLNIPIIGNVYNVYVTILIYVVTQPGTTGGFLAKISQQSRCKNLGLKKNFNRTFYMAFTIIVNVVLLSHAALLASLPE